MNEEIKAVGRVVLRRGAEGKWEIHHEEETPEAAAKYVRREQGA